MNQLLDRMGSLENRVNHLSETTAANTVAIGSLHEAIDAFRVDMNRVLEHNSNEMQTVEDRILKVIGRNQLEVVDLRAITENTRMQQHRIMTWAITIWAVAQFVIPFLVKYLEKNGVI